jgi:hypothetical protein
MKTTTFFTLATITHKKNFIVCLAKPDGTSITEHEQKAQLLWIAFKGISEFTNIAYDLSSLLEQHNLEHLDKTSVNRR